MPLLLTEVFSLSKISLVLWLAQICLTLLPAWFLYSLSRQAKRSQYRERSALPFAAALFTWTVAGVINAVSVYYGSTPYSDLPLASTELDVIRVLLSTINTLFLTIGATRLDNFPTRFGGKYLRTRSNRWWIVPGLMMLGAEILVAQIGGWEASHKLDMGIGFFAAILISVGLGATFLRYEAGKVLTVGIILTLLLLEFMLIYLTFRKGDTAEEAVFLTAVLVTSKVAFMMILVMMVGAWGRYYTSGTIEELQNGGVPQRVRPLFEVILGGSTEYAHRNAYLTILSYWPDAPALLEAIKTEGPSSKAVTAAAENPQMIADLAEAGVLNLRLSDVGGRITNELMDASRRAEEEESNEQRRSQTG